MRKRSCNRLFDNIFWYTVYLLPLILYVGMCIGASCNESMIYDDIFNTNGGVPYHFYDFMINNFIGSNPVFSIFEQLFSDASIIDFTLFEEYGIMAFLSYFVCVYILHLCVDFILFIPRLCHKWMKAFTQGDD